MEKTKQRIIDAAIILFTTKGYDGTSIRELSKKANVNVGHISYYFENKAGLHEHLLSSFFDQYVTILENVYKRMPAISAKECILECVEKTMKFHRENRQLARYVYREVTLDTMLVREIMSTYLTKEKYYYKAILEKGHKAKEFIVPSVLLAVMQLKSMISTPFLQSQYLAEVWHIMPYETSAIDQYEKVIVQWLEQSIFTKPKLDRIAL
ncbi:forespore capture DNA-binding protein RefZ [Sutcliffiella horikoshii]|uniref:forespore capture DNA-binding protein RefZ n=1 Tax=Sutcliffiella horikoshii TaxID=79883 RepID=UPI0007D08811|nr:forespore capture DNA-binding protein RefZ [Sutcliffiella horikoshii]MCM3619468.1 forespore capture DNA-binding protein RefZ [Sutcliffiella horikoshii]